MDPMPALSVQAAPAGTSRSARQPAAVSIPGLPCSQHYLPMPFLEELGTPAGAPEVAPSGPKGGNGLTPRAALEQQALSWVRSKLRAALAEQQVAQAEPDSQAKRRRLSPLGTAPSDPAPTAAALGFATAGHLPLPLAALQQPAAPAAAPPPRLPFVAAPVDWAALAGTLADRAALLAAADADAAQAAALPADAAPGSEGCDPHQPSHQQHQQQQQQLKAEEEGELEQEDEEDEEEQGDGDEQQQQQQPAGGAAAAAAGGEGRERLEPSTCYRGVWRVLSGPEAGRFKAQISTPGRAGRPKRLGYFGTAMAAAQCYDREALEKFGVEGAAINFPATSYGYPTPGRYGLLQPRQPRAKVGGRRPRSDTPPLPTRQVGPPEYLEEPLDPSARSTYTGVRLARNRRGWLAKIKHEGQKLLIGTYRTEEEAARAWDRTAIHLRGPNTQTNFPAAEYLDDESLAARYREGGEPRRRGRGPKKQQQAQQEPEVAQPGPDQFAVQAQAAALAAAAESAVLLDPALLQADPAAQQQAWQDALASAALFGQHPDLLAATAAHMAATAAACPAAGLVTAFPFGALPLDAQAAAAAAAVAAGAAPLTAADVAAAAEAAAAPAAVEAGGVQPGTSSPREEGSGKEQPAPAAAAAKAPAQQQQQQWQPLGHGLIEGQLQQLEGMQHVLGVQTGAAAVAPHDLARLLAMAGGLVPAMYAPTAALVDASGGGLAPQPAGGAGAPQQQQQQ